ncbi:uncharacterized protein MONBRDRAFT_31685 [Monosiga brevicollis MX1]|uniref:tRNA dimethylallyltransferase n=1 Tax=Monosiga brevicollis TaxID=81824 RepID=A9UV63_MONBE|nr:uncharacterized protein MONBRDRAFT_31685 [Monosiga brevicollis MX1]EDQ90839.1 predicted protein [Monosiga brevicollis MX1]|eukprot:XP_001744136.1 hypothetical protein [Monosiga brevicollis MX1]
MRATLVARVASRIMAHVVDKPLICVFGATGTGKTKLSVQIAKHLGGEIISSDSIQVYKGLDIASNKATSEERQGIPHHFLDELQMDEQLTMPEFRDRALQLIKQMHQNNQVPVVVGGTHYYVESLMSVTASDLLESDSETATAETKRTDAQIEVAAIPDDDLYNKLKLVDPASAARLHPREHRKLRRSLEIAMSTGTTQSALIKQEQALGSPLRFRPTLCFWAVLERRLAKRVDEMVAQGLVHEIFGFLATLVHREVVDTRQRPTRVLGQLNFQHGILQAIGFKEFLPLFEHVINRGWLEEVFASKKPTIVNQQAWQELDELLIQKPGSTLLAKGIEQVKVSTARYAKRQQTWIRNRLLRERDQLFVYKMDSSQPSTWEDTVWQPALQALKAMQAQDPLPGLALQPWPTATPVAEAPIEHTCSLCERSFYSTRDWESHLASRAHKKRIAGAKRREENERRRQAKRSAEASREATGADSTEDTS